MEVNRRIFITLFGAAAALACVKWKTCAPKPGAGLPEGISFYTPDRGVPAGRPRSAAIIYLPSDERF